MAPSQPAMSLPTACAAFSVIRPAKSDTVGTKRQVLAHNETYRELCPVTYEGNE